MDSNDVSAVTRFLLVREPKTESGVQAQIEDMKYIPILVNALLESYEFSSPVCEKKRRGIALTSELVVQGFRLILGREPSDNAIGFYLSRTTNLFQFIESLRNTPEYEEIAAKFRDIGGLAGSEAFNSMPKAIYLHIPKTAGKSFENLALSNYGADCSLSTNGMLLWSKWQSAKLVGGHFQYCAYDPMTSARIFLAVVRDPIDRAISRFNFYKNQVGSQRKRIERGFDHSDMKATIKKSRFRKEFINNYQCHYLSSGSNFKAVERAFKQDAFIVGHYDNIEPWIELVGKRLGWTDTILPEINIAAEQEYSLKYREDEELMSLLKKRNKEDFKLVDFIKRAGVYESGGDGFDYTQFRLDSK